MRKFSVSLLAISFFILFLLCSCGNTKTVQPQKLFEADAVITTNSETIKANVQSLCDKSVTVNISSPDTVNGLKYQYINSTLYIEYKGLKCTANADYLPKYNPIEVLRYVLSYDFSLLQYVNSEEDFDVYKNTGGDKRFVIHTDKKTGAIIYIKPSYTDCEIRFSNIIEK